MCKKIMPEYCNNKWIMAVKKFIWSESFDF
jgi:hypothetical protein